jgi:hypothetical protein
MRHHGDPFKRGILGCERTPQLSLSASICLDMTDLLNETRAKKHFPGSEPQTACITLLKHVLAIVTPDNFATQAHVRSNQRIADLQLVPCIKVHLAEKRNAAQTDVAHAFFSNFGSSFAIAIQWDASGVANKVSFYAFCSGHTSTPSCAIRDIFSVIPKWYN